MTLRIGDRVATNEYWGDGVVHALNDDLPAVYVRCDNGRMVSHDSHPCFYLTDVRLIRPRAADEPPPRYGPFKPVPKRLPA